MDLGVCWNRAFDFNLIIPYFNTNKATYLAPTGAQGVEMFVDYGFDFVVNNLIVDKEKKIKMLLKVSNSNIRQQTCHLMKVFCL